MGQSVRRAQQWFRGGRGHRPWFRWYFAAFCVLEVVATIFGAEDDYWTLWLTAPGVVIFGVFAVLA